MKLTLKNHPMGFFFPLLAISLLTVFCIPEDIKATERVLPFSPGEKLYFNIRWGFINAGEAVFEVLPTEVINGFQAYHFVMCVKTTPFIDYFYKVRDRIESYTDIEISHSILYKKQKRGKRPKDIVVDFNWEKNEAQYSKSGKRRRPISVLPGSFDPLSVFYAFRLHDFQENAEFEKSVTDGKKCVLGKALVVKREKITAAGKMYDTFLVEPDLQHLEGVFEKSKDAKLKIWVTADKLRLPVRIESKVIVGSFVGELVSATGIKSAE